MNIINVGVSIGRGNNYSSFPLLAVLEVWCGNVFVVLYVIVEILSFSIEKVIACQKYSGVLAASLDGSSITATSRTPLL